MTRYARAAVGTHRKPQEATPWSELQLTGGNAPLDQAGNQLGLSKKSKQQMKKSAKTRQDGVEVQAADYRRTVKKKKKKQWQKTEWEMLETGQEETRGLAADLLKIDTDAKNPTKYRPKPKKAEGGSEGGSLAERLKVIQEEHHAQFTLEQTAEVEMLLKKDDRRENRRLKRLDDRVSAKTCFNCREVGHDMANCPKMQKDVEQGTGICFKCGSTEHTVTTCHVKLPPGEFPYAKCFICGEQGHLSKQCPDNPRGLYPKGGCCRGCGSVEHHKRDCPELAKEKGLDGITVSRLTWNTSVEDEESLHEPKPAPALKKHKPRVVKF